LTLFNIITTSKLYPKTKPIPLLLITGEGDWAADQKTKERHYVIK